MMTMITRVLAWLRRPASISLRPNEVGVSLESVGLGHAVAVYAPLSPDDGARWLDAFAADAEPNVRAVATVRERLLRIERLEVAYPDGHAEAYDHANVLHWRSLPVAAVRFVFDELTAGGQR